MTKKPNSYYILTAFSSTSVIHRHFFFIPYKPKLLHRDTHHPSTFSFLISEIWLAEFGRLSFSLYPPQTRTYPHTHIPPPPLLRTWVENRLSLSLSLSLSLFLSAACTQSVYAVAWPQTHTHTRVIWKLCARAPSRMLQIKWRTLRERALPPRISSFCLHHRARLSAIYIRGGVCTH